MAAATRMEVPSNAPRAQCPPPTIRRQEPLDMAPPDITPAYVADSSTMETAGAAVRFATDHRWPPQPSRLVAPNASQLSGVFAALGPYTTAGNASARTAC